MLNNRTVDGTTQVGMLVGNGPSFITYGIENILQYIITGSHGAEWVDTCL